MGYRVVNNIWRGAGEPSSRRVSPVRLTSPSFARLQHFLNEMYMYNVKGVQASCVAAVPLNATYIITCDRPFRLSQSSLC